MGHLGNPIGQRLGVAKKWQFNFFIKNIYYPEFINNLINIRDYIYYYLTRKWLVKGGLCLSHLLLYKCCKQFYIKIFIYHIEIEKISYDYMNKLYEYYYNMYNKANYALRKKNKKHISAIIKDYSNSDLFLFYWNCLVYYQSSAVSKNPNLLKTNIYLDNKNNMLQKYSNFILYKYLKLYIKWRVKQSWFSITNISYINKQFSSIALVYKKEEELHKKKKNANLLAIAYAKFFIVTVAKKLSQLFKIFKIKVFTIVQLRKLLRILICWMWNNITHKVHKRYINRGLDFIQEDNIAIEQKKQYSKVKKQYSILRSYFIYFLKKKNKQNKALRAVMLKNKFKIKKAALYDAQFSAQLNAFSTQSFSSFCQNKKLLRVDLLTLFLYLSKKVNFQKVRNAKTLNVKWLIIVKYIKLFYFNGCINPRNFTNIQPFIYLLYTFIHLCNMSANHKNVYFNLKDALYYSIYFGLFYNGFAYAFKSLIDQLKRSIKLLYNAITVKNLFIYLIFLTNETITTPLISRYIALKLLKGFTIKKIIYPLKKELTRLSVHNRISTFINRKTREAKWKHLQRHLIIKRWFSNYIKYYFSFFLINYFNIFKLNDTLIFINIFYDKYIINKKKLKDKRNRLQLYYKKIFNSWLNSKVFLLKMTYRKTLLNIYKAFTIRLKVNIKYPLIFNFDKKDFLSISLGDTHYIQNAYYTSFKFLNTIYNFIVKKKKINNMNIYISSFFSKNYINYGFLKALWLRYKHLNIRNIRQAPIQPYNSSVLGFKLVLKGRFSRVLRASKTTVMIGRVPLNNLNLTIDYNFLTIPITNSAISIKLYMYKNASYRGYKQMIHYIN